MKTTTTLPNGYRPIRTIDLQKDKRLALWVNLAALVIAVGLVLVGLAFHPFSFSLEDSQSVFALWPKLLVALVGMIVYVILHELTHGCFIRLFGKVKPDFGFTGMYAFAGSKKAWFSRGHYLVIALAPVVLWGIVFLVLNLTLPDEWFWPVYFWQICNLSGAAGDLYVTQLMLRVLPRDTLTMDTGVSMTFYSAKR